MSSTDGSPTNTGWKRRSSAGSFSMCLRYSSSVVAPTRAQLAAREHRLEHVAGVHRALGGAGADDRVQLVDEDDDLALGVGDLLQDGLEPVLELAAVLGPGDHRAQVECDHAPVLRDPRGRRRRRSAGRGPRRSPSCRRRARRSAPGCSWCGGDSTWITRRISSSRPITGSSLPSRGGLGQVAAVALERLESCPRGSGR